MQVKHGVIIPAYNAANYIEQSLMSVLVQLGPDDEVVVIDDGSLDHTIQVVQRVADRRVRLLSQPSNVGIAAARNRGLGELRADYVHFLDHDDLWCEHRMSVINDLIGKYTPDVISGWVEHFYCPIVGPALRDQYALPGPQAASLPGTVVLSRRILDQLGLFDQTLTSGEFMDFISKAMGCVATGHYSWIKTDTVLQSRRIHGGNHTLTDSASSASYLAVVRRHLQRNAQARPVKSDYQVQLGSAGPETVPGDLP